MDLLDSGNPAAADLRRRQVGDTSPYRQLLAQGAGSTDEHARQLPQLRSRPWILRTQGYPAVTRPTCQDKSCRSSNTSTRSCVQVHVAHPGQGAYPIPAAQQQPAHPIAMLRGRKPRRTGAPHAPSDAIHDRKIIRVVSLQQEHEERAMNSATVEDQLQEVHEVDHRRRSTEITAGHVGSRGIGRGTSVAGRWSRT